MRHRTIGRFAGWNVEEKEVSREKAEHEEREGWTDSEGVRRTALRGRMAGWHPPTASRRGAGADQTNTV